MQRMITQKLEMFNLIKKEIEHVFSYNITFVGLFKKVFE